MQANENAFHRPNIIFFSGTSKLYAAEDFVREHVLCHIFAGELRFTEAETETIGKAGDTILFRRDLLVKCEKRPCVDGQPFRIVYFVLERELLRQFEVKHQLKRKTSGAYHSPVLYVQPKTPLTALIHSIRPYIDAGETISEAMKLNKLAEAVIALLEQDENLGGWLFDVEEQGKIDLRDFMQRNYMFNIPMTKFAELTGRSLSTFQRDFRKTFGTNAGAWLLKRRLQAAYEAISTEKKAPADIYHDFGFEDIAHFSRTFKKEFGCNASQLNRCTREGSLH